MRLDHTEKSVGVTWTGCKEKIGRLAVERRTTAKLDPPEPVDRDWLLLPNFAAGDFQSEVGAGFI